MIWYNGNSRQAAWAAAICEVEPGREFDQCFASAFSVGSSFQEARRFLIETGFEELGMPPRGSAVCRRFEWQAGDLSARHKTFRLCHKSGKIIEVDLPGENLDQQ
jgi:hypothetical protein